MARDFTYIDDIISGLISAIDKSYPYEIFNLAFGKSAKLTDYIVEIEKHSGKKAKKNLKPIQPGDVPITSADIAKAKKMLNYHPKTPIQSGVGAFIDWYKKYYKI